jgi:hypothetical protein
MAIKENGGKLAPAAGVRNLFNYKGFMVVKTAHAI